MNKFLQLLIIPFLIILLSGCGSSDSKKPVNGNTDSVISETNNSTNNGAGPVSEDGPNDTTTDNNNTDSNSDDDSDTSDTDGDSAPNDTQVPNAPIGVDSVFRTLEVGDIIDFASDVAIESFGGVNGSIADGVLTAVKTEGAETWGGNVIAKGLIVYPLTAADSIMSARVYSDSAATIRMKLELASDGNQSAEVDSIVAHTGSGWETLEFNFANTNAIDANFDTLVLFSNFGVSGAGETYQYDDITFVGGNGGVSADPEFSITFQVDMTAVEVSADGVYLAGGNFGQDGHLMTDAGNGIWSVTLELTAGTYLYKFRNQASNGGWDGFEDAAGIVAGGCNAGDYNDRSMVVADTDATLGVVAYGSCTSESYVTPEAPAPTDDDGDPLDPSVGALPQQLITVEGNPSAILGQSVSISISYDVSDNDSSLTGLGLNVHYDSSVLTFTELSAVLATDNISSDGPFNDDEDLDNDASTDKYVSANWASLFGSWPGELPASLLTINFDTAGEVAADTSTIGFSSISNTAGYAFASTSYDISILDGETGDETNVVTEPEAPAVSFTVTAEGAASVKLHSSAFNWDASSQVEAVSNGDGTWTATVDPRFTSDVEYTWIIDEVEEDLSTAFRAGECTNDNVAGFSDKWFNRTWAADAGDVTGDIAGACSDTDLSPTESESGILVGDSADFNAMTNATWKANIVLALKTDGASSQATQTISINVTELPEGGANYRVYKTTANGNDYFGTAQSLEIGINSITVGAVGFDRAVKIQVSSTDIKFDALSVNGMPLYP